MKNILAYFDNLDYEFIETYSFRRGPKLESLIGSKGFSLDGSLLLLDEGGQFDLTAEKIAVIKRETNEFEELIKIIRRPIIEIPHWMCAPFYRDALIFRSRSNGIVDTLNICFECSKMQDGKENFIGAGKEMYHELQSWLKSLGHVIGEDESLELREKIKALKKTK